jgi:hypothetical protein
MMNYSRYVETLFAVYWPNTLCYINHLRNLTELQVGTAPQKHRMV